MSSPAFIDDVHKGLLFLWVIFLFSTLMYLAQDLDYGITWGLYTTRFLYGLTLVVELGVSYVDRTY